MKSNPIPAPGRLRAKKVKTVKMWAVDRVGGVDCYLKENEDLGDSPRPVLVIPCDPESLAALTERLNEAFRAGVAANHCGLSFKPSVAVKAIFKALGLPSPSLQASLPCKEDPAGRGK